MATLIHAFIVSYLINACHAQNQLPIKYPASGTVSCITYQPFTFGNKSVSVSVSKSSTICTSVRVSGSFVMVVAESVRSRVNCSVDRTVNNVTVCFNTIMKTDAGVYKISAVGGDSRNGTVLVMDKPTTPTISPTSAEELKQITLTCTSSSTSAPSPTGLAMLYTWTVDGTAPVDQRYSVSNNLLIIHTVQRGDKDRVFQCVATEYNGLSSDRTDLALSVTYRPVVSASDNVTTVMGTRSQLSCNVLDANPSTIQRYKWYKDTHPTAILTTTRTLTLASANRQDYGIYSCKAENSVGMSIIPASAAVIVQFSPDSVTLSGNTILNEDTTLTLRCNATLSNPQSTFTWYKNGAVVTVSSQVTTTDGMYGGKTSHQVYSTVIRKQDHRANITCVATNTVGTSYGSVILNIRYKPIVEVQPASQVVIEGNQNTVFKCVVSDANPSPDSYLWRKGGSSTTSVNQNYTIQNVRRSNTGSYSCTSTNIAGTSTQATGTLHVLYPPEIAHTANQTSEESTTLSMTCTITTSNPAPNQIYWTRSKDPTFRQNNSVLTIPNISRGYTDTYTCHAENIMSPSSGSTVVGSDQKQVIVDVQYGPGNSVKFDPVNLTISMEENNTRSIPTVRCLALCNPPCQCSWTGNTGSSNATLNLGTASRDKNGTYTCKASNSIGGNKRESQKELSISIFYHAVVTSFIIQGGSIHNEHSDVSLVCTVDSYPKSTVTWTSTSTRPTFTQQANPTSTLLLRNVSCSETANYTCSAYNGYGRHSMNTTTLFVKCTPRLFSTDNEQVEIRIRHGENVSMSSLYMAYPEPTVTWLFKAASSNLSYAIAQLPVEQIDLNVFISKIDINFKEGNVYGEYRSVAQNQAGSVTAHQIFLVAANGQPSKATHLAVKCQSTTSANISWSPGFNGGVIQWFNIMYRPFTADTYMSGANISSLGYEQRKSTLFSKLTAGTQYFFKVKSSNNLGFVLSTEEVACTTLGSYDSLSTVYESYSGVMAGIFFAGLVTGIIISSITVYISLYRRKQKNVPSGHGIKNETTYDSIQGASEEVNAYEDLKNNERIEKDVYINTSFGI